MHMQCTIHGATTWCHFGFAKWSRAWDIIEKHTYMHTNLHTWPESVFLPLLDFGDFRLRALGAQPPSEKKMKRLLWQKVTVSHADSLVISPLVFSTAIDATCYLCFCSSNTVNICITSCRMIFFLTRGQFHKAKKFVITKIIFVITKISDFVFSISTVC